jgi:translocation and assembly module TamB
VRIRVHSRPFADHLPLGSLLRLVAVNRARPIVGWGKLGGAPASQNAYTYLMPFGKGRRKLFWVLGFLLIGFATLLLLLPVWFPWALRPLASKAGAHFSTYERLGYARFSLHSLDLTNQSLILHVHQLDAFVPSVWLWKLSTGRKAGSTPFLRVDTWDCDLPPTGNANSPLFSQVQDAATALGTVRDWVPKAALSRGTVRSGTTVLRIPDATWTKGHVQAAIQLPPEASGQFLDARLTPARPFDLEIQLPALRLESTIVLSTNLSGLDLQSSTVWESNRFELQAHFGRADTLPDTASLRAQDLRIPGSSIKLPYYSELTGSLLAEWKHGQFAVGLTAAARPATDQTNLPSVDINLHVRGDTNSATVDKLAINLPFAEATLSNSASLTFTSPYLRGPASLNLNADLARQQWVPLTGRIAGVVEVSPGADKVPGASLRLTATNVGLATLKASAIEVSARFGWPLLEVTRANAHFDDGSAAALSGKIDLDKLSVSDGQFQFRGPLGRRWLPQGYSYGNVSASGTFEGPLDKLLHAGRLEADRVVTPMLQPLALSARWNGQAKDLQDFELNLSNTNSSVAVLGALVTSPDLIELKLRSLSLATNHLPALDLAEPVIITFAPKSAAEWRLDLTPLRWVGHGGEITAQASLQWPNQGAVQFSVQDFALELLAGLSKNALPNVAVRRLSAYANWTNGPASVGLDFSGTGLANPARSERVQITQQTQPSTTSSLAQPITPELATEGLLSTPLNLELRLKGDAHGIILSNLVVNSPTSAVVAARGFLPLTFTPGLVTNGFNIDSQQPLVLNASVHPEAFFWETLAEFTGVRLEEPNLSLDLSGTWKAPAGLLTFRARRIKLKQAKLEQLNLEDLRFALVLDREKARLNEGQLLVQGQRLSFTGELPLGENSWIELAKKKLPDWNQASAVLRIPNAQLAAFEPLFPEVLAPQGELDLDLRLLPGPRLEGALDLKHAQTRPLGNIAPFRDINGTLRFHDRVLVLENASANLSGAGIDLTGRVDLRGTNWLGGELPPFELTLRGTNVPLAREPEYIIRSDLDLAIAKTNDAPPRVTGAAHLRDSFYLSDLSALVPGGVAKPSSRPPYFSINNPTLADWRLAVTVDGIRWLKLRTSLFNGEASANLHLQGTLKDPIVLGGVKIDSGVVRFPFASLEVQQGLVTLSSQDPYHPQLLVRAASKQFGYDIRLEVSGAVDAPVIQFSSNPSLSSEQILLMLTAGQLPQGTYTLTPQQRAQTVALFLGRDLLSKLGLSDQTQERLTIRSGEEISEQGRPTYHVEYKLTPHWFVVGEYDRFGDFNAGLKWRIYSR